MMPSDTELVRLPKMIRKLVRLKMEQYANIDLIEVKMKWIEVKKPLPKYLAQHI